ncbi:IPT/TIG domain-containing protein [Dactylosporangium sp. NPDC049525]|uniref:beta strand repeat-containing protein n=1 Tax=Dactylosporangium sp. NPDC049525 TaxID=3154730 RepID=UPI003414F578
MSASYRVWAGVFAAGLFVLSSAVAATPAQAVSGAARLVQAAEVPVVAAVSPTLGTTGTPVTITGTDFTGATTVTFGGVAATSLVVVSATQITATAPAHAAGAVDVVVTTALCGPSTGGPQFTYAAQPAVSSLSPNTGSTAGGTSVTITGTALAGASAVTFGGVNATSYTVDGATQITAVSPAGTVGAKNVVVTTPGGTSTATPFTYAVPAPVVASLSPSSGSTLGGTSVVITGTNLTAASAVTFGGVNATSFTVDSSTQITAVSPAGTAGAKNVVVTTPTGPSVAVTFTYQLPSAPVVSSLSPTTGTTLGGTSVVVTGTGFTGASAVTFDGVNATSYTVDSATQITAVSPAGAAGARDVVVTTTGGSSTAVSFTYVTPTPVVSSLSPTTGTTYGGTSVVITGTDLTAASAVTFGGVNATSFTVDSSTQITAVSPAGTAGAKNVVVTTPGGSSTAVSYTYVVPTPVVSSLSPTTGTTLGGTSVTITGTGFTGASAVTFDAVNATSFTVNSATQITAVSPARTAGAKDVVVTTAGGTSVAATFTYQLPPAPAVTSLSPTSGTNLGGTSVVITGTSFTGASAVTFDGGNATSYTVDSATQITAVAPAHANGAVAVAVTGPGGTGSLASSYTYADPPAPVITALSPDNGPEAGGTSVVITGTDFTGASKVTFDGVDAASYVLDSATQITAVNPAGTGTVDVVVETSAGASAAGVTYEYKAPPVLCCSSPSQVNIAGGDTHTVTGLRLDTITKVTVDGADASFTKINATSFTFVSPAHAAADVDVVATGPGGLSNAVTLHYDETPTITSISPATGDGAGGDTVTITGTNLIGVGQVSFGGTFADMSTLNGGHTDTSFTITTPSHTDGMVNVAVYAYGGQATEVNGFEYQSGSVAAAAVGVKYKLVPEAAGACLAAPSVTAHPTAQTVAFGSPVTFTAAGSGNPTPTVRWQTSADGSTWTDVPAATSSSLTFTPGEADAGRQYRAVFHNSSGADAVSDPAALTVNPGAPGAPTGVVATAGVSSIAVSWTAPVTHGTPVTGYLVSANPGPATCTATAQETGCVLGAEAGKSYTVAVVATSAAGNSAAGPGQAAIAPTAPTVPSTPPDTDLTLTTDKGAIKTAEPGEQIVVIGTGFAPHSTATITIYSDPVVLGTVVTDQDGNFTKAVTVPPALAAGAHTLAAQGVDPDGNPHAMKLSVTVATSDLAVTGAPVARLAVSGLLMLLAGICALRAGRQRRRYGRHEVVAA